MEAERGQGGLEGSEPSHDREEASYGTPCLLLGSLCHRDTRLPTVPAGFASCYPTGFMRNNPLVYTASVSRVFMRAVTSETGQGRAGRQLSS